MVIVGFKTMQEDLGTERSTLALAGALVWVGTGLGGILMGRVADRIGMRATALIGACMMAAGLAISATGSLAAIFIGHALLIGLLGNGALYPPLVTYVSRWFDRKRGTAIALISSGQYVAGVIWPFRSSMMARFGWRTHAGAMPAWCWRRSCPLALCSCARRHSRHAVPPAPCRARASRVMGLRPNAVQAALCLASFLCCVPMALPNAHLVAFCSDIGISPADGAAMLSVLLGALSSAGSSGARSPTAMADCARCLRVQPARHWQSSGL